jgi:SAM-dependent methyltransferase
MTDPIIESSKHLSSSSLNLDLSQESVTPPATRTSAEFWSNPLAYRQVAATIQHVEGRRLSALYAIAPNSLVIDLGCGDGSLTYNHLLNLVPEGLVVGVDSSSKMVESASQYAAGKPGSERLHFLQGDIADPSTHWFRFLSQWIRDEGRPTVIFTNSTLHHIYDWPQAQQALRNIVELLSQVSAYQPTRFLASFAGKGNFDCLIECCDVVRARPEWQSYFASWKGYPLLRPSAERMAFELFDAGFDLNESIVDLTCVELLLDSEETLFKFTRGCMKSFMGHLQQALKAAGTDQDQEEKLLNEFAQSVADEYLKRCPRTPAGEIVFPEDNIEISIAPWVPGPRSRYLK